MQKNKEKIRKSENETDKPIQLVILLQSSKKREPFFKLKLNDLPKKKNSWLKFQVTKYIDIIRYNVIFYTEFIDEYM